MIDPFEVFDDVEDDFDEFMIKPEEGGQNDNNLTLKINQSRNLQLNDNSQVMDNKNSDKPAILVVEKIVYLPEIKSSNDRDTQTDVEEKPKVID